MKIDKHERTITISQGTGVTMSVAFIITAVMALVTGVTWVNGTQNRIDGLGESVRGQRAEINELKDDNASLQLGLTDIRAQLRSIDTSLVELKDRI